MYELTGSTLLVGLLGVAALVPLLTVPLYAGAVADAVDRRLLLLWSDVALALVSVVLLVNALADEPRASRSSSSPRPSRPRRTASSDRRGTRSPRLVPPEQLTAAIVVEDVVFNLAHVAGPALG